MAQPNEELRHRIEKQIEYHRMMLGELNKLLSGTASDVKSPVAAPRAAAPVTDSLLVPSAGPSAAPTGAKRGRPRGRKRRPSGWLMDQSWAVLSKSPGSTVSEMAQVIFNETQQSVNNSLLSTLLSNGADQGLFLRDNSGGPRKTRWSIAPGASKPNAGEETPVKRKPGRPRKNP